MINNKEDDEMTIKEIVFLLLSGVALVAMVATMVLCILMLEA